MAVATCKSDTQTFAQAIWAGIPCGICGCMAFWKTIPVNRPDCCLLVIMGNCRWYTHIPSSFRSASMQPPFSYRQLDLKNRDSLSFLDQTGTTCWTELHHPRMSNRIYRSHPAFALWHCVAAWTAVSFAEWVRLEAGTRAGQTKKGRKCNLAVRTWNYHRSSSSIVAEVAC